jgi:ABC-2 type transport system ATP-binding protein
MTDVVISAQQVFRQFKEKEVLRGVDLEIPRGSVVGLIGKNAAGKSTLIKCMLGLLKINAGMMRVFGDDAWWLSADSKARLGYVPQEITLYSWMRVGQILDYTAAFYPRWNWALTNHLIQQWELPKTDRVGPLSTGQLQKLAIVLAMGYEPDLLVLDEPVLFSTHITTDLERVADRVAILRDGRIVFHGELDVLKENVKRLRITADRDLPASFMVRNALHTEVEGCNALVAVADATDERIAELGKQWNATVDVEDLSLEEIFLELHHK